MSGDAPSLRHLVVMRHAKSSWETPQPPDHDRPLAERGRLGASLMGAWLAEREAEVGFEIAHALISTSLRTRQTWARTQITLGRTVPTEYDAALYLAEPSALLARVKAAPDAAAALLIMGHNDGLELFAASLCLAGGPIAPRMPTAAVAIFEADLPTWRDAAFGEFRLRAFETPKSIV